MTFEDERAPDYLKSLSSQEGHASPRVKERRRVRESANSGTRERNRKPDPSTERKTPLAELNRIGPPGSCFASDRRVRSSYRPTQGVKELERRSGSERSYRLDYVALHLIDERQYRRGEQGKRGKVEGSRSGTKKKATNKATDVAEIMQLDRPVYRAQRR